MGKESKRFTRCFHGWGPMRTVPAWFLSKIVRTKILHQIVDCDHNVDESVTYCGRCTKNCPNRRKCCLLYISIRNFLSTMHMKAHGHCPLSIATRWHNWSKISLLQLRCFKCIYPPHPKRSLPRIFQKVKAENDFRCDVMGVAVLQLYPVQDNRTGPQVVDLLTKRIVNQGAISSHFLGVTLKPTQVLHRRDNSLLTAKFIRVSLRLPTCLLKICELD